MNTLEAFENFFGIAPSDGHTNQATHPVKGGLNDPRTAASFPDQIANLQEVMMEVYPTIRFAPEQLLPAVQLWAFEDIINDPHPDWLKNVVLTSAQRKPLESATFEQARQKSLVELAYEEILERPSDGVGLAHYQAMLDDGLPRHVVIRHIELSPEAEALRAQRHPKNGVSK